MEQQAVTCDGRIPTVIFVCLLAFLAGFKVAAWIYRGHIERMRKISNVRSG